jgi:hypothetical protein
VERGAGCCGMVLEPNLPGIPDNAPLADGQAERRGCGQPPGLMNEGLTRRLTALGGVPCTLGLMKTTIALLTTAAGLAVIALAGPATAGAAVREYEGTVVSVNRDAKTFRLHDAERGTIRIKVKRSTRFERLSGFSALHPGMKRIEVAVRRTNGRWVATVVERSGGGGDHGDDD